MAPFLFIDDAAVARPDNQKEPVEHLLLGCWDVDEPTNSTNIFLVYIGKRCVGSIRIPAKQKVLNWALAIANMVDVVIG